MYIIIIIVIIRRRRRRIIVLDFTTALKTLKPEGQVFHGFLSKVVGLNEVLGRSV